MIDDKSQGTIAKHFSWDGLVRYKLITQFAGERIFNVGKHLSKLLAKWLIVSYAPFALHFCSQRFRTHHISKITCVLQTETVTNCCYVNRQMSELIINKYQTAVNQFWLADWQTDAISNCQLLLCVAFCCNIFFFVTAVVYSQSLDFLCGWCEHLFCFWIK